MDQDHINFLFSYISRDTWRMSTPKSNISIIQGHFPCFSTLTEMQQMIFVCHCIMTSDQSNHMWFISLRKGEEPTFHCLRNLDSMVYSKRIAATAPHSKEFNQEVIIIQQYIISLGSILQCSGKTSQQFQKTHIPLSIPSLYES